MKILTKTEKYKVVYFKTSLMDYPVSGKRVTYWLFGGVPIFFKDFMLD